MFDNGCIICLADYIFGILFSKGCYADDSNNLAMFKAVLKKNRDGGKGSKKDSGMWKIRRKTGS